LLSLDALRIFSWISRRSAAASRALERDRQMMFENQTLDEHKDESRFKVGAGPTERSSIADCRPRRLKTYRYLI
jgi:hypothetical protein